MNSSQKVSVSMRSNWIADTIECLENSNELQEKAIKIYPFWQMVLVDY